MAQAVDAWSLHGALEQVLSVVRECPMDANLAQGHLRVGVNFVAGFHEALALLLAGSHDAAAEFSGPFDSSLF